MTELLFMEDQYLKEFSAIVTNGSGNEIELDKTAFYPEGGGQPCDLGTVETDGNVYNITHVKKENGKIIHVLDREGLKISDNVHCRLDWPRRYTLMRNHTAAHVLSEVIHKATGAMITGNQLGIEKSRIDFSLEVFDKERIKEYVEKANELLAQDVPIKVYFIPFSEADPSVTKLAMGISGHEKIRIVEIGDIDKQADGGTHVANVNEVGRIDLVKIENKGKNNRRVYFKVV
jgi:misacylated tRNA(Ala) deacylase